MTSGVRAVPTSARVAADVSMTIHDSLSRCTANPSCPLQLRPVRTHAYGAWRLRRSKRPEATSLANIPGLGTTFDRPHRDQEEQPKATRCGAKPSGIQFVHAPSSFLQEHSRPKQSQPPLVFADSTAAPATNVRYAVMTTSDYHASDLHRPTFHGLPCASDIPTSSQSPSSSPLCREAGLWSSRQKSASASATVPAVASVPAIAAAPPPAAMQASVTVPVTRAAWRVPAETQVVWLVGLMAAAVRNQHPE